MKTETKTVTILITAVGNPSMPGIADCFHKNGERRVRIIGVDMAYDPTIRQMVDEFYQVPSVFAPDYMDRIFEICQKERVDIFFPFMDEELLFVWDCMDRFTKMGVTVSIAARDIIETANDKLRFYDFMRENGLHTPDYLGAGTAAEVKAACLKLGYPKKTVCVKTLNGTGSRGVRVLQGNLSVYEEYVSAKPNSMFITLDNFLEILSGADQPEEMMVMDYLPGDEYCIDLLADHGRVLYMVGRESDNVLAGITQACVLKKNEEAYEMCKKIIKLFNYDGNAEFDFKYDAEGKPVLLEMNPRLSSTMSVIAVGGVNLPYLQIKRLLGEELPILEPRYGVRLRRRYLDMYADEKGKPLLWKE